MRSWLRFAGVYAVAGFMLIGAAAPAVADPEGDSPVEYLRLSYDFDPEAIITACGEKFEKPDPSHVDSVNSMNDRFICLQDEIHKIWRVFFDDETRERRQLDAKLDQMIGLYAHIFSIMAQENAGCQLSCGTMWIGYGLAPGVEVLENILRKTEYFLKRYPPVEPNPEFIEWNKAGRPPWPPQPAK